MSQLPIPSDRLDQIAFPLAIEAVLGVIASGKQTHPNDQQPAHDWIVAALKGKDPTNAIQARAMHFVGRILDGPKPI